MPYQHVTTDDLVRALPRITQEGMDDRQIITAIDDYARELDYERSKAGSSLFTRSMGVGTTDLLSNMMRGLTIFTGEGGATEWLANAIEKQGAFGMKSTTDPMVRRHVAEAAQGPLWGEGAGDTWTSLIGQHVPLISLMATGSGIGGLTGKGLGLTGAALKAAEIIPATLGIGLVEGGSFLESATTLGVDRDIAESIGLKVGTINGAIEELQYLQMMGPWSRVGKKGIALLGEKSAPIIKRAASELGIMGLEGIEEGAQGFVTNKAMAQAFREMRARHGESWKPNMPYTDEDLGRAAIVGGVLAGVTRGAGRVASVPTRTIIAIQRQNAIADKITDQVIKEMEEGKTLEESEVLTVDRTKIPLKKTGQAAMEERTRRGLSAEETKKVIRGLSENNDRNTLVKQARRMGIEVRKPEGGIRSDDDLIMEMESKLGLIEEGPMFETVRDPNDRRYKIKRVKIVEPIVNKVDASDFFMGRKADKLARYWISKRADLTQDQKEMMLFEVRRKALRYAKLGVDLASSSELNDFFKVNLRKGDQDLHRKLTRQQYARYMWMMEGQVKRMVSVHFGRDALASIDPKLAFRSQPSPVTDENGEVVTGQTVKETPVGSLLFSHIRPKLSMFIQTQNRTGLNFLGFDFGIMNRNRQLHETQQALTHVQQRFWKVLPKRLRAGSGRRAMHDFVTWLKVKNSKERRAIEKQLGLPNSKKAFAQRVLDLSKSKLTTDEVIRHAEEMVTKYEGLYDWFVKNGAIPQDHYRKNYVPLIRKIVLDKKVMSGETTIKKWADANMNEFETLGMSEEDVIEFVETFDMEFRDEREFGIIGEATPFYEYARNQNARLMQELDKLDRNLDIEEVTDLYMRQMLRKIYFQDAAPSIRTFMNNVLFELRREGMDERQIKQIMTNYLDDIMGVPDNQTSVLRSMNLRSHRYMLTRLMDKGMSWWNDTWGRFSEFPESISPSEVVDTLTTLLYSYTLGLPANWKSPIKNVATQNVMAGVIGMKTYLQGMMLLSDPERVKMLKDMNLRPEFAIPDFDKFAGRGRMRAVAERLLSVYRASDQINVVSAASAALVAWDRLQPELAKDPKLRHMTREQFDKIVFKEKKPSDVGIDDRKVMDPARNISWAKEWKSGSPRAFKGISAEMFGAIRDGRVEDARRMWLQYMVNLSQWRYGTGGTPQFLRNPMMRLMFMYTTWPLNYMEYTAMVLNLKNGLLRNAMGVGMSQLLIATMLSGLGLGAWKWIGTGPLPDDLGFFGPFADFLDELLDVFKAGGETAAAKAMPTVSKKEAARSQARLQKAWESVMEPPRVVKTGKELLGL